MKEKQFGIAGLVGGISIGLAALAFPSAIWTAREFAEGMLGIASEPPNENNRLSALRAVLAAPTLNRALSSKELEELFQGMTDCLNGRYAAALPTLSKYAMMGSKEAQSTIGQMFYFGHGLPLDREEGVRWFSLAAAQGGLAERQTLAAAANGSLEWESTGAEQQFGYAGREVSAAQYDPGNLARTHSHDSSEYGFQGSVPGSGPMGARRSIEEAYGSEPAGRGYPAPEAIVPQAGGASPVILNRAGPGTYSDSNGDIYTPAGPHGVVNTRTGEFRPTN